MKLQPHETDLIGQWIADGKAVRSDPVCARIDWLIQHYLKQVAQSKQWGAWETLFQDPVDGRFWERTYPQGEMQGGGPPRLTCITAEQAQAKYPLNQSNATNARPEATEGP